MMNLYRVRDLLSFISSCLLLLLNGQRERERERDKSFRLTWIDSVVDYCLSRQHICSAFWKSSMEHHQTDYSLQKSLICELNLLLLRQEKDEWMDIGLTDNSRLSLNSSTHRMQCQHCQKEKPIKARGLCNACYTAEHRRRAKEIDQNNNNNKENADLESKKDTGHSGSSEKQSIESLKVSESSIIHGGHHHHQQLF